MASATVETILILICELLPHSANSPDLAPSNYHMYGPLKDALHGCQYANSEDVKDKVYMWLCMQLKTFFTHGIRKFTDQNNKCVEEVADYIKKLHYICSRIPFAE
jgi:histone-lysine N-methyltransferase SETMAR